VNQDNMPKLKLSEACKQAWLLPQKAVSNLQFVWRHGPISRREAERVDRICRPGKYLGKDSEVEEFERKRHLIGITHYFSWTLFIAGVALIVLGSRSTTFFIDTVPDIAAGILLGGIAAIGAGLAILLRRRSI
jgi:hypothetical protein